MTQGELLVELESLGIDKPRLNKLNDEYEIENLVDHIKKMYFREYKSASVFGD